MFNNILAISNMQNSAIIVGYFLDDPRNFSGSYPFSCIFESLIASDVDEINSLLNLRKREHVRESTVILQIEPGKNGLEGSICASPSVVIEGLITIVIVFIDSFCIVLNVLFFFRCFDK